MSNPHFNLALGDGALTRQSRPPATFMGVTARVFPLKANMYQLWEFCDNYLNVASDFVYFRPSLPFVYLMVLDYGRMSEEVANMGWVSQREVAFAVPLEWYELGDDRTWHFIDLATVCPFIYVDDEMSLSTGRQVYGWPKVKVWLDQEVNPWAFDPRSGLHLLRLETLVFPELYAGRRQEPRVLLEVQREPLGAVPGYPTRPDDPAHPFRVALRALTGAYELFGTFFELTTRAPQLGYGPGGPWRQLTRFGLWTLGSAGGNPILNNITLKQFRDAARPDLICYQALLNSQIGVRRFNGGGLLGDTNLLLGDPSGGFRVLVNRYDAEPVVESLGIDVARRLTLEGHSVDVLEPMFPYWVAMDLDYGLGNHICWRTLNGSWHRGEVDDPHTPPVPEGAVRNDAFNTSRSGAVKTITGPFDFPNTTLRVLPLLAHPERLDAFVKEYLDNDLLHFEAWGSCVYLVATSYEEMSSETNNIGWWADRELQFLVPVRCLDREDRLESVGLVPAFTFTNTSTAAITGAEVRGQPTVRAELESPPSAWMRESGPSDATSQGLLRCRTQVLPALRLGQEARMRTVLEIERADALAPDNTAGWRMVAAEWGRTLLADHRAKVETKRREREAFEAARALALELLVFEQPFNLFSLKQFRDAHDPNRACYQSLVRLRRTLKAIWDIREIEEQLHLVIYELPTQPIVKTLGLRPKWVSVGEYGKAWTFQPLRPFWMRLGLREHLGEELCRRAGTNAWQVDDPEAACGFLGGAARNPAKPPRAGRDLLRAVEASPEARQRFRSICADWVLGGGQALSAADAAAAVQAIEPQIVIESILSARWGHAGALPEQGPPETRKPDLCIRTDSVGPEQDGLFASKTGAGRGARASWERDGWYSEDEWPAE